MQLRFLEQATTCWRPLVRRAMPPKKRPPRVTVVDFVQWARFPRKGVYLPSAHLFRIGPCLWRTNDHTRPLVLQTREERREPKRAAVSPPGWHWVVESVPQEEAGHTWTVVACEGVFRTRETRESCNVVEGRQLPTGWCEARRFVDTLSDQQLSGSRA